MCLGVSLLCRLVSTHRRYNAGHIAWLDWNQVPGILLLIVAVLQLAGEGLPDVAGVRYTAATAVGSHIPGTGIAGIVGRPLLHYFTRCSIYLV